MGKCCQKMSMHHEDLRAEVLNYGIEASWLADMVSQWGDEVLYVLCSALRNGFSKQLVTEVMEKFSPVLLELFVNIFNKVSGMAAAADGKQFEELLNASLLETLLKKYLPVLVEKYGDQIVSYLVDWLMKAIVEKSS